MLAIAFAVALVAGTCAALFALGAELDTMVIAAAVGSLIGAACLAVAIARFDVFILGLLALRPALDGLSQGTQVSAAGMTSPSVMVGLAFLGAGGVWLVQRASQGRLVAPSPISWAWLALVGAACLSCIVSEHPVVSVAATLRLAAAGLMFVVLEQALANGLLTPARVVKAVAAAGVLVVAWSLLQVVTGTGAEDPWTGLTRVTGPFVHPSVLAKFLIIVGVLLAALLLSRRPIPGGTPVGWVALAAVVICLGLTYTRVAWIAAALAGALITWRLRPLLLPVFGLLGAGVVVSIPSIFARVEDLWISEPPAPGAPDTSLAWRVQYWSDLLPLARMSPLNGRGLDTVSLIGGQNLAAHNIWVQSVVEMGLVGLATLLTLVIVIALQLRRSMTAQGSTPNNPYVLAATAIACAMLLMSLSENLLNETTTLWYFSAVLACACAAAQPRTPASKALNPRRRAIR